MNMASSLALTSKSTKTLPILLSSSSSSSSSASSLGGQRGRRLTDRDRGSIFDRFNDRTKTIGDQEYLEQAAAVHIKADRKHRDDDGDDGKKKRHADLELNNFTAPPNFRYIRNYEQYLDHYITWKDLYYFESEDISRTIMTLGFRVPELYNRDQFKEIMSGLQHQKEEKRKDAVRVGFGLNLSEVKCPLMQALIERETGNRSGVLACIIYIRTENWKHQEVSGWIDYRLRLKKEDPNTWYEYFTGGKKLIPRPTDLCYYNFTTLQVRFNSSEDYLVTTDIHKGLQFENKLDRKLITVDPHSAPGDNSSLTYFKSPFYEDCAIYDHEIQFKA